MTNDEVFVLPVPPERDKGAYRYITYSDADGSGALDLGELLELGRPIVTLGIVKALLESGVSAKKIKCVFIDVADVARYFYGLPAKEFRKEVPWSIHRLMGQYYSNDAELVAICWVLNGLIPKEPVSASDMDIFIQRMAGRYLELKTQLVKRGDWSRFANVEVPIFNLFLKRSLLGIRIDRAKLDAKLAAIEDRYYRSLSELRTSHRYRAAGVSAEEIRQYLNGLSTEALDNESDLYGYLKARSGARRQFAILLDILKNQRTRRTLLELYLLQGERVHPEYDVIGTVTGRILVKAPCLQIIRKEHRDVVVPDDGKALVYLDYCCFEPTILAALSNDKRLVELCNSGDLYTLLANDAGFSGDKRSTFKVLFMAYSYGMAKSRLRGFISELLGVSSSDAEEIYDASFEQFEELNAWKESVWNDTLLKGFSESIDGNRRYRKRRLPQLEPVELRWAVNQKIQGTASYILKQSIMRLEESHDVEVLLPMHDAVLLQIGASHLERKVELLRGILEGEFQKVFANVKVRVRDEAFYQSE